MGKIFRFLITVVGLPLIAHGIQSRAQPDKLGMITFLSEHRKEIMRVGTFGLCAGIFVITGLSFTGFSFALRYDLNLQPILSATMITSLLILAVGLTFSIVTWRLVDTLIDKYAAEEVAEEPMSLGKTIVNSILNSFLGSQERSRNYFDYDNQRHNRNMLN